MLNNYLHAFSHGYIKITWSSSLDLNDWTYLFTSEKNIWSRSIRNYWEKFAVERSELFCYLQWRDCVSTSPDNQFSSQPYLLWKRKRANCENEQWLGRCKIQIEEDKNNKTRTVFSWTQQEMQVTNNPSSHFLQFLQQQFQRVMNLTIGPQRNQIKQLDEVLQVSAEQRHVIISSSAFQLLQLINNWSS